MTLHRNDCRCNRCGTATTPDSASTSWARLGVDAHHTKVDLGARGEPGPRRRRRPTDPDERLCRASSQTTTIRGVQSAAIGGGDGDRLPVLRRSCHPEDIRQNQAAERRQPVEVTGDDGLVHSRAIGTAAVGTKSRSGPPPTIGTRGVVLVQIADVVARRAVHSRTAGKQSHLIIDRNRRGGLTALVVRTGHAIRSAELSPAWSAGSGRPRGSRPRARRRRPRIPGSRPSMATSST